MIHRSFRYCLLVGVLSLPAPVQAQGAAALPPPGDATVGRALNLGVVGPGTGGAGPAVERAGPGAEGAGPVVGRAAPAVERAAPDIASARSRLALRIAAADSASRRRSWTPIIAGAVVLGAFGAYTGNVFCHDTDSGGHTSCAVSMIGGAAFGAGVGSIAGAFVGVVLDR